MLDKMIIIQRSFQGGKSGSWILGSYSSYRFLQFLVVPTVPSGSCGFLWLLVDAPAFRNYRWMTLGICRSEITYQYNSYTSIECRIIINLPKEVIIRTLSKEINW